MRWNCPYCFEVVSIGIDIDHVKKAYIRCSKCRNVAVVQSKKAMESAAISASAAAAVASAASADIAADSAPAPSDRIDEVLSPQRDLAEAEQSPVQQLARDIVERQMPETRVDHLQETAHTYLDASGSAFAEPNYARSSPIYAEGGAARKKDGDLSGYLSHGRMKKRLVVVEPGNTGETPAPTEEAKHVAGATGIVETPVIMSVVSSAADVPPPAPPSIARVQVVEAPIAPDDDEEIIITNGIAPRAVKAAIEAPIMEAPVLEAPDLEIPATDAPSAPSFQAATASAAEAWFPKAPSFLIDQQKDSGKKFATLLETPARRPPSKILSLAVAIATALAIASGVYLWVEGSKLMDQSRHSAIPDTFRFSQKNAKEVSDSVSSQAHAPLRPPVKPKDETARVIIRVPKATLRSGPGTDQPATGTAYQNGVYPTLRREGEWFEIRVGHPSGGSHTAWIRSDSVLSVDGVAAE